MEEVEGGQEKQGDQEQEEEEDQDDLMMLDDGALSNSHSLCSDMVSQDSSTALLDYEAGVQEMDEGEAGGGDGDGIEVVDEGKDCDSADHPSAASEQ